MPALRPPVQRLFVPRLAMLAALAASAGCKSAAEYRAATDREVYAIVEERRAALGAGEEHFSIEPPADSLREQLLSGAKSEVGTIDLAAALEIAAENSREYRTQRERLYLAALDLTLERYRFRVHTSGQLSALVSGTGDGAQDVEGGANFGLSKLLGTGATIVGSLGLSVFRNIASGDGWDAISTGALAITQPLLAGSSPRIVREPLTQAERNVVYAVREYERFRREFAVQVATRVYRLLQQEDTVHNEENNLQNLQVTRARNEALSQAGRLSDIEADQAHQEELSSTNRLIVERQSYSDQIDDFKLFLGLPITTGLRLDSMELSRLAEADFSKIEVGIERLDEIALTHRLDYQIALDTLDDAARHVEVAADALRARLDLVSAASFDSPEGHPLEIGKDDFDWSVGANLQLPFDRFVERNRYRETLIAQEVARRDADELGDQIRVDVRAEMRDLEVTLESYGIQQNAAKLAERRVENTRLNLDAGRASTRDILEAQQDLLLAQNAVTRSLIDYHLSRLALFRDLELLRVDAVGISLDLEALVEPPNTPPSPDAPPSDAPANEEQQP